MTDAKQRLKDQIVGSIVGGAIGDALGGVSERGCISISDDTQLTLATCEAIVACGDVLPAEIARRFADQFRAGAFTGLGASTLKALRDLEAGAHWALSGSRGERAAGNGAAMRIAPLAFVLDPLDSSHRTTIRDVCRITHHSDEAYCGALAVLIAIRFAAFETSWPQPDVLQRIAKSLPDSQVRDRFLIFAELPANESIGEIAAEFGATGFVADTVPLAVLCAMKMDSTPIESVIADLNQTGGDTDTIGSIAGQIFGAYTGFSGLSPDLVAMLPESLLIVDAATRFAASGFARRF